MSSDESDAVVESQGKTQQRNQKERRRKNLRADRFVSVLVY